MIKIDSIEFYEYECGFPCTPDGCKGHVTDIPISITINGVRLVVEGADRRLSRRNEVKKLIKELEKLEG